MIMSLMFSDIPLTFGGLWPFIQITDLNFVFTPPKYWFDAHGFLEIFMAVIALDNEL